MSSHPLASTRTGTAVAVLLLAAVCLAGSSAAQRRTYTLDDDPLRLGNKALAAGRLDEARASFQEAVANDHRLPDALCGLAVVDLRQGLYAEAEADYRQALAASGGRHRAALAGLGLLLLRQGQVEEAAARFDQALLEDDKLWEAHYGLARIALAQDDWSAARGHLDHGRKAKGLEEGQDKYQYGLALYLLGTGDATGAERAALTAQVLNPVEAEYARLVSRLYSEQGHVSLAINAFEQALATPGMKATAPVLHELGRLYAQENRFNEASDRYLQAVAADSSYAPALKDLGDLYLRAHRYDRAAGTYLRYVALAPDDGAAQLGLSECLGELGRYDEAAAAARTGPELAPGDQAADFQFARTGIHARSDSIKAEAADVMGGLPTDLPWLAADLIDLAAFQTGGEDFDGAAASLARAAAMAPDDARIPFQQGIVDLRVGRAEAAVGHFQQAVDLDPGAAANHLNLGIALYQAGRMDAAVPAFRQAVSLRPELAAARLLLAQVLAATGSIAEAKDEYQGVLKLEPQNAKALRGLGFCHIRAADYAAAASAYIQATEADPANVDGWAGLGSARLGQGNLVGAESAFARARAIDPSNIMLKTGMELLNQAKQAGKENQ